MKACIIGGGIGGLSTASLLVKRGWKVDVYEREKILGGRALSCKIDENYENLIKKFEMKLISSNPSMQEIYDMAEYKVDLGFHLVGGGKKGGCIKLLKELKTEIKYAGSKLGFIGQQIKYPILSPKDKFSILPRIFQLLFARKSKIEEMKKISMEEIIEKYGKGKMKLILELFPRLITTVNDLSRISAGETFFAQRELMGGDPVIYPYGGLSSISNALAKYIHKRGKIFLNKKVNKILIEDGKAVGIEVGKEERIYELIISTIPVQHFFTIADEKEFPEEWVNYIKNLTSTGSVVSYHALDEMDENLLNKSFVFIERNVDFEGNSVVGMVDFKMNYKNGVAPNKKYLIQSYAICSPEEAKNKSKAMELAEIIEKNIKKLIPDYEKNMEWRIYSSIWHLDGVAKTIDSIKPDAKTPVKNLYFAGDCVASKGVGVNCSADSANLVIKNLEKEKS